MNYSKEYCCHQKPTRQINISFLAQISSNQNGIFQVFQQDMFRLNFNSSTLLFMFERERATSKLLFSGRSDPRATIFHCLVTVQKYKQFTTFSINSTFHLLRWKMKKNSFTVLPAFSRELVLRTEDVYPSDFNQSNVSTQMRDIQFNPKSILDKQRTFFQILSYLMAQIPIHVNMGNAFQEIPVSVNVQGIYYLRKLVPLEYFRGKRSAAIQIVIIVLIASCSIVFAIGGITVVAFLTRTTGES